MRVPLTLVFARCRWFWKKNEKAATWWQCNTKIRVYQAVVLTTLLYGGETVTLYWRHIKYLEVFHLRCLPLICEIKWSDRIPNTEVLRRCGISGIENILKTAQFRWVGSVHLLWSAQYWYQENWMPSATIQRQSQKESQKLKDGPRHMAGIGRGPICLENQLSQNCPHIWGNDSCGTTGKTCSTKG